MRGWAKRLRDAVVVLGLASATVLVIRGSTGNPPQSPRVHEHDCRRDNCPLYNHSDEAWNQAITRDQLLCQLGVIDADEIGR